MPGDRRTTGEMCSRGGPTHACGGKLRLNLFSGWGTTAVLNAGAFIWMLKANLLSLPTVVRDGRQGLLGLGSFPAFLWQLCLPPQAHLLACQRWGNSFSPTYCLLEGVRLSPDSLGTWPGSYPHTKTSVLILGLWLSLRLTTAPSDKCTVQRRSCHPVVCPYGTTGKTTAAFYQ